MMALRTSKKQQIGSTSTLTGPDINSTNQSQSSAYRTISVGSNSLEIVRTHPAGFQS
jgi:hypothetical protein